MPIITEQELINAQLDAQTLASVVNDDATPGTLTSRLGTPLKTLAKLIDELATQDIGAPAASAINVRIDEINETLLEALFDNPARSPAGNVQATISRFNFMYDAKLFEPVEAKYITIRSTVAGTVHIEYARKGSGTFVNLHTQTVTVAIGLNTFELDKGSITPTADPVYVGLRYTSGNAGTVMERLEGGTNIAWFATADGAGFADLSNHTYDYWLRRSFGNSLALSALQPEDIGTTAGKLVALDGTGKLPAVDGSQLTGVSGGSGFSPRLIVGDNFYHVAGDPALQLFYRGMVEALDPYQFFVEITGGADAYRANKRYYNIVLASPFTHGSFNIAIKDSQGTTLATKAVGLQVVAAVGAPATAKRVLCIGDSLTANLSGAWVTELNRRLTGTGGSPAGKAYGNITFIGTQGTGANKHEGYSGYTWQEMIETPTSPFLNGGVLDFANYVSTNSFGGIEQVYILLGWNTITSGGPNASDWSADIARAETLIDAILDDYPSAKITLLSMQCPGREGRISNRQYIQELRAMMGYKLAIKSIADDVAYTGKVDWIDLASQFDSDYNMPQSATAVNTRSATTELVGSDAIHPNANGYNQIADAVYRHFIAKWCQ